MFTVRQKLDISSDVIRVNRSLQRVNLHAAVTHYYDPMETFCEKVNYVVVNVISVTVCMKYKWARKRKRVLSFRLSACVPMHFVCATSPACVPMHFVCATSPTYSIVLDFISQTIEMYRISSIFLLFKDLSPPKRPDRLWGSRSLVLYEYRGIFLRG